jgi:hypothetical protein
MLLHVGLNLVVEAFHDALERFRGAVRRDSGAFELLRELAQFVNFGGS